MREFVVGLCLAALLLAAPAVHAQEGVCGDVTGDGLVSIPDYIFMAHYLFDDGPAPESLWTGNLDGIAGITVSDLQRYLYVIFISFAPPSCGIIGDTFPVWSDGFTYLRETEAALNASQHVVELWHLSSRPGGRYDGVTGYSFPFTYACSTSAVTLDSIVPVVTPNIVSAKVNPANATGLFAFSNTPDVDPAYGGKTLFARLYFTIGQPSPTTRHRIVIDTTSYAPSNTYVTVEQFLFSGREPLYGTASTPAQPPSCCVGMTGDVNSDGSVTISDLTRLVNFLFVTFDPLDCPAAGNTFGDDKCYLNLTDVTRLMNRLFVTFVPTDYCNQFDNFICDQFY